MISERPQRESSPGAEADAGAGLYIHVPFCTSVCPYCDFAVTIAGEDRRRAWAEGIVAEAAMYSALDLEFDTVYLGGGTPSCLDPAMLKMIFAGLDKQLRVRDGTVRSLEINPEDVTPKTAAAWRELGIDVVSLGVQSFDDRALRFLGRSHSAENARTAASVLVGAGFETVSLDLIFGLDGQTAADWRGDLSEAVDLGAQHLSCYQLTIHDGTIFGRRLGEGRLTEMGDPAQAELYFLTHEVLGDAGFEAYEVSNFASSVKHRSRHNLKYWDHTPYLGLGPSAHSFVGGRRWWNRRKVRLWQSELDRGAFPVSGEEIPTPGELVLEELLLGLRTVDGVDLGAIERSYGLDLRRANVRVIEQFRESGHLIVGADHIRPTIAGLAIADTLARAIDVPEELAPRSGSS